MVQNQPKNAGCWNTLGAAHYRAGDWKAAVTALDKSMQLHNGGDSFDWVFLAMAQRKLGHNEDARKLYDKAFEWVEKNKEELEKDVQQREELQRFLAEAKEVLGLNGSSGSKK